ncbi:MAG TPA: vitamin K epoxide reductase family protein [Desulfuromonadales bacterium]|nr:vitamin K epoxide reductase family protein [Desulfuromonadales bacterium]
MRNDKAPFRDGSQRTISALLWLSIAICWLVSIFSVIQELCMVTACRDTVAFTFLGINLGWLGIVYFSFLLMLLWQRRKSIWLNWVLAAMVFAGVGAEFRLLWIQKYVIGGWCPLCVSICCALFCAGILLALEKKQGAESVTGKNSILMWVVLMAVMCAVGLTVALLGVKALE